MKPITSTDRSSLLPKTTRLPTTLLHPTLLLTLLLTLAHPAHAGDAWTVLPLQGRGLDTETLETFRDLVISELTSRNGATFVTVDAPCADAPCARKSAAEAGAAVALFGRISRLGDNLIVTLTTVDVAGGATLSSLRMRASRVEDLEAIAARMAQAIVEGRTVDETAALGTITEAEQKPDRRREGDSGLALRIGGVAPVADGWRAGFGMLVDLGYWYEARDFAIEPRLGYRGTPSAGEGDDAYFAFNADVIAHYLLTHTDIAPYVGLGGGLRVIGETRIRTTTVGKVVRLTGQVEETEEGIGGGAVARAGLLLFRTYTLRVALNLDYDVSFVRLHGAFPQSLQAGIGVVF